MGILNTITRRCLQRMNNTLRNHYSKTHVINIHKRTSSRINRRFKRLPATKRLFKSKNESLVTKIYLDNKSQITI